MGSVSTAVGCAVGIPVGVGIIVGLIFWYRLQRRFKREERDDKELETEIYDEGSLINFDNINSWRVHPEKEMVMDKDDVMVNVSSSVKDSLSTSDRNVSDCNNEPNSSNKYIPAYRKKIKSFQRKSSIHMSHMDIPNSASETYLTSSPAAVSEKSRKLSVYDQMVPVSASSGEIKHESEQVIDDISSTNSKMPSKENLLKNLYSQDFGSYYPRRPSTSNLNYSTNESSTSIISPTGSVRSDSLDYSSPQRIQPKKNLGFSDSKSDIIEEDQYDNEFTNYSTNKREFINNLTPKRNVSQG